MGVVFLSGCQQRAFWRVADKCSTKPPRSHVTIIVLVPRNPPLIRKATAIHELMSSDFWAGYLSGAIGIVIGNPLELIKVRLQAGLNNAGGTETTTSTARSHLGHFESASSLVRGMLEHTTTTKLFNGY